MYLSASHTSYSHTHTIVTSVRRQKKPARWPPFGVSFLIFIRYLHGEKYMYKTDFHFLHVLALLFLQLSLLRSILKSGSSNLQSVNDCWADLFFFRTWDSLCTTQACSFNRTSCRRVTSSDRFKREKLFTTSCLKHTHRDHSVRDVRQSINRSINQSYWTNVSRQPRAGMNHEHPQGRASRRTSDLNTGSTSSC